MSNAISPVSNSSFQSPYFRVPATYGAHIPLQEAENNAAARRFSMYMDYVQKIEREDRPKAQARQSHAIKKNHYDDQYRQEVSLFASFFNGRASILNNSALNAIHTEIGTGTGAGDADFEDLSRSKTSKRSAQMPQVGAQSAFHAAASSAL